MLTQDEKAELEQLRRSAAKFICDPLEKAFFQLESILDRPVGNRVDEVMPASAFRILSKALIELKKAFDSRKINDEL